MVLFKVFLSFCQITKAAIRFVKPFMVRYPISIQTLDEFMHFIKKLKYDVQLKCAQMHKFPNGNSVYLGGSRNEETLDDMLSLKIHLQNIVFVNLTCQGISIFPMLQATKDASMTNSPKCYCLYLMN